MHEARRVRCGRHQAASSTVRSVPNQLLARSFKKKKKQTADLTRFIGERTRQKDVVP